jgi:hypothetical protein
MFLHFVNYELLPLNFLKSHAKCEKGWKYPLVPILLMTTIMEMINVMKNLFISVNCHVLISV